MRSCLILALLLLLVPMTGFGHSVEPGVVNVPAKDGRVRFYLRAVNRYDDKMLFVSEAFINKEKTETGGIEVFPKKFFLGPDAKTSLFIRGDNITVSHIWVCTRTIDLMSQLAFSSRVCSKVGLVKQ